jgi:asparagine synthase (glutamine-hydrolysing)
MNIVGCVGLSRESRQAYLDRLEAGIRIVDWLDVKRWEFDSSSILCAANSLTTRVEVRQTAVSAHLYFGSGAGQRGGAIGAAAPSTSSEPASAPHDICHLTFAAGSDGCRVAVDALGLFPLYYYSSSDFFLFSSSMWVFGKHAAVSTALDTDGLIGMFLSQGIVAGRTLVRGVRRLAAGYAVSWRPGQTAEERASDRLVPSTAFFGTTFEQQLEVVDAALRSATAAAPGDSGVLLSGGLDSRLLAGYLSEAGHRDVQAVSLGSAWQFDVKFAQDVAQRLGWRHRSIAVDTEAFCERAVMQARHEQLVGSFWDLAFWQLAEDLSSVDPVLVSGFCGNYVFDPLRHDPGQTEFAFARTFASCNKYGFAPGVLQTLLRVDHAADRIADVRDQLRREYESFESEPFQKVTMFDLTHRARFLVGAVVWRVTFGTRLLAPYADRRLVEAALGLPLAPLRQRKLQRTLLQRKFPALARLPLDTASFFTRPVSPRLDQRLKHLLLLVYHGLLSRRERRYYHSVFDLNSDGWRAVRREAEKSRTKAEAVLDRDTLRRLLPPPDTEIKTGAADFFQLGSRVKSLLAFMLWAGEHL